MPLDVSGVIFETVRGWVSHQALRKVQEQRQLLQKPFKAACSQSFTSSHGLPCAHMLKNLEEEGRALLLEHFNPHWHLKRDAARPRPLLEPRRVLTQVIQTSSQPPTSTRREPSRFELVGTAKAPSKCSACHQVGHNMRANICPLKYSELLPASSSAQSATLQTSIDLTVDTSPPAAVQFQATCEPSTSVPVPSPSPDVMAAETAKHDSTACSLPETLERQRYDSPEAIYERYVAARSAWYSAQPAGSALTDREYRKAMKVPSRYPKASYEWCLDYKYMGKVCQSTKTPRPWTTEEVMAYLDWSDAEDARVEEVVRTDFGAHGYATRARGPGYLWAQVDRDIEEREHFYKTAKTSKVMV